MDFFSLFSDDMVDVVLSRGSVGIVTNGEYVKGIPTLSTISIVNPQPVTGRDMKLLEDGSSVSEYIKTWISSSVGVSASEGGKDPDIIIIGNKEFVVFNVEDYTSQGGFVGVILRCKDGV